MSKPDLRATAKAVRAAHVSAITPAQRCCAAVLLADRVCAHLAEARSVAAYLPIGSEIDPLPLIARLDAHGVRLALPHVTSRQAPMRFVRWAPGDVLIAGPMGLRQPDAQAPEIAPDVILVPLLAFDARLHRLGYGAGHYDRALAALPDARRIGLAWAAQRVERVPDDAWDVPLHAIATETEWITP